MNLLFLLLFVQILRFSQVQSNDVEHLPEVNGNIFYYFGYGSNMLTKRIHIQNPTAVKIGPAVLQDYRLDFNLFSDRWNGSVATVVEHPNRTVQGTLWQIDLENLDDLDNQEGVSTGLYKPLSVCVMELNNNNTSSIIARVYLLVNQPATDLQEFENGSVPFIRQPSKTYLQCLVKGAIETELEQSYIEMLKSIKHNARVQKSMEDSLELKDVQLNV